MSRSKRKKPIFGITTSESEAEDKRLWHKRMRARVREQLHHEPDPQPIHENAVGSVWAMSKDGKHYWFPRQEAMLAKLMRK